MVALLLAGVLAAAEVINLPGNWRSTLGFADDSSLPCHRGLYRDSPEAPPAPGGHWRFEPPEPKASVESSSVAVGPIVYALGGSTNFHQVLVYDVRRRQWSEPTALPVGLNHVQATTYGDDIYLAGGYLEGAEETSDFWQYDPAEDDWTELPPMQQARGGAGAAVIDDKLYVAGGAPQTFEVSNPGGPYDSLESYDFVTKHWTAGPDAPFAVHHVNATALRNKLYLAGGRTGSGRSSKKFFRYDPRAERWEALPDLPAGPYSSIGIVHAAGKVIVFGGDDEYRWEEGDGSVTPTAWAFDPRSSRWQRLPDLTIERHAFGAVVADGRIYAIGGSYCPGLRRDGHVPTHTVESLPVSAVERAFDRD